MTIDHRTVPMQHFLVVTYDGGIFHELHSSGFVGLSPKNDQAHLSFIRQLKLTRLIENAMFAIKFSNVKNDDNSVITFGEYDPDIVGDNAIVWEKNQHPNKWLINTTKVTFGDQVLSLHSNSFEVATAETHMRLTRGDFEPIEKYLRSKFQCTYSNSNYLFYCYVNSESLAEFPSMTFTFEKLSLTLPASDYVEFSYERETGKKIAILQIEVIPAHVLEYNAIGVVVLRNYYTIFDMDNQRIGFAIPQPAPSKSSNVGLVLGILLPILIILLLVGGYFGYRKYKYGTWFGKSTTQIVTDQALLASNTL